MATVKINMRKPPPSMNDKERVPLEYQTIRVREQPADRYLAMYLERVKAGKIEHKTSRELSRHGKRSISDVFK